MNNTLAASGRAAVRLGGMRNSDFLKRCLSTRFSRTHTLATGRHLDLATLAVQAGFRIHVYIDRPAFVLFTQEPSQHDGETADLWQLVQSLRTAIMEAPFHHSHLPFKVAGVPLEAHFGRVDYDDPRPAITVVLSEEQ